MQICTALYTSRISQVDVGECKWTKVDESDCRLMQLDAGVCLWTRVAESKSLDV